LGVTYLLISHDLALAGGFAGEIAVLDRGTLIEHGPAAEVLSAPRHPLTRELVEATRALTV
jgi:peptide/nickel transport system ATP-binding protein